MFPYPAVYCVETFYLARKTIRALVKSYGGQLHGHFVPGQNSDVMHLHLPGNEALHYVPIFQLDLEGRIGEVLNHLTLHLNVIFPGHYWLFDHWRSLEVSFLQEAFILV